MIMIEEHRFNPWEQPDDEPQVKPVYVWPVVDPFAEVTE